MSKPRVRRLTRPSVLRPLLACSLLVLLPAGCSLVPEGTEQERQRLADAGEAYRQTIEDRVGPELPAQPGWRDLLRSAFLTNGELEATWREWAGAVARVDAAGAWPNTNLALGVDYLFSDSGMKSWDRTTLTVGFDPMENLAWPSKTAQAARVALDEAREAGERFRAEKFALQKEVLE